MRLKRLELFGFKSFADRTVLDFKHSLVGIVGPNGCGKSNVVDAVRWVLGEQRASSMRGGEMADVIFKGSVSRPALAVAEVTMVLDNESESLEGRGEEVGITRRVFKSGEGEYLIDGERVRLKDVREMLYGTGLGSRGYAFLEQGKIDAVLSANPLERRTIFEEAAGISRYRQRIKETTSRLKRVDADLLRLDDVLGELEKRERSLKIQAGRAQRFLAAREEWTREGLRYARHQMHHLREEAARSGRALAELERRAEARRTARQAAEADVASLQNEQEAVQGEVDRLGQQAAELAGDLRALDERVMQLGQRIVGWRESAREEEQRARELETKRAAREEQRAELAAVVEAVEREVDGAEARARELEETCSQVRERSDRARAELDSASARVLQLLDARTSWKNRVQHLTELLEPLAERVRRAEERCDEARAAEREAAELAGRSATELERRRATQARLEEERHALENALGERGRRMQALEAERSRLELEAARLASRIESLIDWEREREGLESGAQGLLSHVENGELTLAGDVRGLLADHLRVDAEFARALDAALESRAAALVCTDPADMTRALAWLKEGELGRASLILARGLGRRTPPAAAGELSGAEGVEGRLLERLELHPSFAELASVLLGDVLLVRDVARGVELVERYPELRFVTREGDLVDAAGLSGGHVTLAQGPVGRRAHAAELEAERSALSAELEEATAALERERASEVEDRRRLDEVAERLRECGRELARARGEAEAAEARRAELERSVALFEHEQGGLAVELERAREELVTARGRDEESEARYRSERERLDGLEERRARLEEERETLAADAQRASHEARTLAERREELSARSAELERESEDVRGEMERIQRLSVDRTRSADEAEKEREALAEERVKLLESRGQLEERLTAARERERTGRDAIQLLRQRGESITGELEGCLAELADGRLEHQRVELSLEELGRRAEDDFQIPAVRLLEDFEPEPELVSGEEALARLGERVAELKRSMERCGPVNLEAVDELSEVSERLGFMSTQRGDLLQAKKSLEGTIEKLNAESERRFVETFEEVEASFRTIFRQLFGGGNADILLLDEEQVLDSGLEIIARPPGRESLPISLLSGGQRTMTALALLFSVFRAQPSPFCILDEVDAALDDANIGRFLSLLDTVDLGSQFIVVTHNKGTMSACDVLYGVTMAVRGVSHVVSVELADVDEFVPEATGSATPEQAPAAVQPEEPEEPEGSGEPGGPEPGAEQGPATEEVTLVPFRAGEGEEEDALPVERDEGVETAAR